MRFCKYCLCLLLFLAFLPRPCAGESVDTSWPAEGGGAQQPPPGISYILRGEAMARSGDPFAAINEYRKAIAAGYSGSDVFRSLSTVLYLAGFTNEAIDALKEAVRLHPKEVFPRQELAVLYFAAGRNDEAKDTFRSVLAENPTLANPYYYLGLIAFQQDDFDDAWLFARRAQLLGHKAHSLLDKLVAEGNEPLVDQQEPIGDDLCFRQILVSSFEEAEGLLSRIKRGEMFEVLASLSSMDPSAENGGFVGCLFPDEIDPVLGAALWQKKAYAEPTIVETTRGSHLMQRVQSFDPELWRIQIAALKHPKPVRSASLVQRDDGGEGRYVVHAGTYNGPLLAASMVSRLRDTKFPAYFYTSPGKKGGLIYQVVAGRFAGKADAKAAAKRLNAIGVKNFIVTAAEESQQKSDKDVNKAKVAKAAAEAKKLEVARAAQAAKEAKAAKAVAEAKKVEVARAAQAAKEAEAAKAVAEAKKVEVARAAQAAKEAKAAKAVAEAKEAEVARAAQAVKEAEAAKAVAEAKEAEVAKEAKAAKAVAEAKKVEVARAAQAAKEVEAAKAAAEAKKVEVARAAQAAKEAGVAKAAAEAKEAEVARAAQVANEAEAAKVAAETTIANVLQEVQAAWEIRIAGDGQAAKEAKAAKVEAEAKGAKAEGVPAGARKVNVAREALAAWEARVEAESKKATAAHVVPVVKSVKGEVEAKEAKATRVPPVVKEAKAGKVVAAARKVKVPPVVPVAKKAKAAKGGEVVKPEAQPVSPLGALIIEVKKNEPVGKYTVHAGTSNNRGKTEEIITRMRKAGLPAFSYRSKTNKGAPVYRLVGGRYNKMKEARAAHRHLAEIGIKTFIANTK